MTTLNSTQMTSLMRPLSLHASALSDTEYDVYTASLHVIADEPTSDEDVVHDDAHYEQMSVGVREVRAWLRGRYSHISACTIDSILKYFSPNLGQGDALTGGQFFAALRLVVHVDNGKEVDRSLAFVQGKHCCLLASLMLPTTSQLILPAKLPNLVHHPLRHYGAERTNLSPFP